MSINHRLSVTAELATVRDYLRWATSRFNAAELFFGHGTDNAWDEAVQLVMPLLHLSWDSPSQVLDACLTMEERRILAEAIERRIDERIPAAYITGVAWFAGEQFYVDERVLVPRSPIAEMIEQGFSPWLTEEPARVLDLCAGSGCIGIACALMFDAAEVWLADIDSGALEVANRNIHRHKLDERVNTVKSDVFASVQQKFDLIVCNPPYVNAEDLASMPAEYQAEPAIGLGSGSDGLDFMRSLLKDAVNFLEPGGLLVAEVGNSWPALEQAFPDLGFTWVELERGGHGVFVLTRQQLESL